LTRSALSEVSVVEEMSNAPFQVEVDTVDRNSWDEILARFEDANIDQTWAFASAADSRNQVSHLLLKRANEIVACCQVEMRRIPALNLRVADVRWGPLVCRRGIETDHQVLPQMIRALKEEYGLKRRCFMRIAPHVTGNHKEPLKCILENQGFRLDQAERPYRTLMLDLSPSLDELRSNLLQRWRRHLNKAEKNNLTVVEGTNDELFQIFLNLAAEMCERKELGSFATYQNYRHVQRDLPQPFKMNIMVCQHEGRPVAATIGSAVGSTGIYLLGATGQAGLGLDASYLLHWRMIQWFKSIGTRLYDLGAINPQLNPGGFFFKQGIAGKLGWDETFLHRHYGCFTLRSRFARQLLEGKRMLQGAR
jgi:lipid II:glycine glycyltransferase (peptidoglycan interpeptide bridge formation enzyme)